MPAVIITAWSRTHFVKRALASAWPGFPTVVVSNMHMSLPVPVVHSTARGFGKFILDGLDSLNLGDDDLVLFLNDDDEFLPMKRQVVQSLPDDLIFYRHGLLVRKGNRERPDGVGYYNVTSNKDGLSRFFVKIYCDSSIVVRKSLLDRYRDVIAQVRRSVDSTLFSLSLVEKGRVILDDTPLARYYVHGGNSSYGALFNATLHEAYLHDRELVLPLAPPALRRVLEREIEFHRAFLHGLRGEKVKLTSRKYTLINRFLSFFASLR